MAADYWTTPKINWVTNDGIGYDDLNRIEQNTKSIAEANRKVHGFGFTVDNSVVGQDGVVTVKPGSCYSENGVPIRMDSDFTKNLTTWSQGNGATFGGVASAVTVDRWTWYYIFVIMDPTDGSVEIMIDDNPAGTNVSSGTFTEKRFINSIRTGAAGDDGSYLLNEMYSTGDKTFINPNSMLPLTRSVTFNNTSLISNSYQTATLEDPAIGYLLPARAVLADLNITSDEIDEYGLISLYESVFTVPTNLESGGLRNAEFLHQNEPNDQFYAADFSIMVTAARQVALAMTNPSGAGFLEIAVRGFTDERFI